MKFFITGGSRGLGAGMVVEAAKAGHDVAFTYVANEAAAKQVVAQVADVAPGVKCQAYQMQVSDADSVERTSDAVLEDFETVEVIVNCAGKNRDNLVVSMSDEEWAEVIGVNLTGPFLVVRQFLPALLANRFGRIVNISSIINGGGTGQANYAASKAGLHGFTKSIAKEYGRKGITANVVVPGFFDTDMTRETMPEQAKEYWRQYCPMPKGRMGEIAELAGAVMFLASPAGGFINGEVINVTGGLNWTT